MTRHLPILVEPIVSALIEPFRLLPSNAAPHWIVDCTFGGGGHTAALLGALAQVPGQHGVLGFDQDPQAIDEGKGHFAEEISEGRLILSVSRMTELEIPEAQPVLGFLADLGVSSDQLEDPQRGLSFQTGQTLDMRMDPSRPDSAESLLKKLREQDLADLIFELGEERFSRRIASAIVRSRRERCFPKTAQELGELIRRAVPPAARHGRIHAATRTFQALRMAVNQEIEELDFFLQSVILKLRPGGRAALLSFHSLEDRRVKERFRQLARQPGETEGEWKLITPKAVSASEEEVLANPRARSAHLRIIERMR